MPYNYFRTTREFQGNCFRSTSASCKLDVSSIGCKEQTIPKTKSAPHLLVQTTKTKFHRNLLDNFGILNVDHKPEQKYQKRSQN